MLQSRYLVSYEYDQYSEKDDCVEERTATHVKDTSIFSESELDQFINEDKDKRINMKVTFMQKLERWAE